MAHSICHISSPQTPLENPQRKLALAFAIVKTKPADISIGDFLPQLRRRIQKRARPKANDDDHQHLDSAAFWREAYEQSEKAQLELKERIFELERRLELGGQSTGGNGKRKADAFNGLLGERVKKIAKTDGGGKNFSSAKTVDGGGFVSETLILRHIYQLKKALSQKKPDPKALAQFSVHLCAAGSEAVKDAVQSPSKSNPAGAKPGQKNPSHIFSLTRRTLDNKPQDLTALFNIIHNIIYLLLLQALRKTAATTTISRDNNGRNDAPNQSVSIIIHALIQLFRNLLQHLQTSITQTIATEEQEKHPSFNKNQSKSKTVSNSRNLATTRRARKATTTTETISRRTDGGRSSSAIPTFISNLLMRMIMTMDPRRPESSQLLEGYLACLLDRVGQRLCLLTFGEDNATASSPNRNVSRTSRQAAGLDPKNHHHSSHNNAADDGNDNISHEQVKRKVAEAEGIHLVQILRRAMSFVQENPSLLLSHADDGITAADDRVNNNTTTNSNSSSNRNRNTVLNVIIREKLQKTLLRGVFGEEDDTSLLFRDALKQDIPIPTTSEEASGNGTENRNGDDDDDHHDFVRDVWELVGWQVLERALVN